MHEILAISLVVLKRDLRIYMQHKSEFLAVLLFFVIIVSLFPLAFGPLPPNLVWLVPGIIWIAALLSILLAQESMVRMDYQVGIIEQLIISPYPLSILLLAKIIANWLVTGLPLILMAPLLALSFSLNTETSIILALSLALGTPVLTLVGTLGAALTLSLPRGGILLAVLTLPLYIPVLVLGTAASILTLQGLDASGCLALLAALAIVAILLVPLALSALVKVSVT